MTTSATEALKMAIAHIGWADHLHDWHDGLYEALNACKEALEQPAQEPYRCHWVEKGKGHCERNNRMGLPDVYTHPHQWQGLTDDEMKKVIYAVEDKFKMQATCSIAIARAIEQALKEKNHE